MIRKTRLKLTNHKNTRQTTCNWPRPGERKQHSTQIPRIPNPIAIYIKNTPEIHYTGKKWSLATGENLSFASTVFHHSKVLQP